jgi:hypothetical protein
MEKILDMDILYSTRAQHGNKPTKRKHNNNGNNPILESAKTRYSIKEIKSDVLR